MPAVQEVELLGVVRGGAAGRIEEDGGEGGGVLGGELPTDEGARGGRGESSGVEALEGREELSSVGGGGEEGEEGEGRGRFDGGLPLLDGESYGTDLEEPGEEGRGVGGGVELEDALGHAGERGDDRFELAGGG